MRVVIRPDLGPSLGTGHVMRTLALAEQLVRDGHEVVYACDIAGVPWVRDAITSRGARIREEAPAKPLALIAADSAADALVVDSYTTEAAEFLDALDAGVRVVGIVDNERRGTHAELLVDANPGSEADWADTLAADERLLAGTRYALIRDEFRAYRRLDTTRAPHEPLRVLTVFGGTDAAALAPRMAAVLRETGSPLAATVITRPDLVEATRHAAEGAGGRTDVITPTARLPELVAEADVVIAAAGSMSWELLSMGAAVGLVAVADNQRRNYARLVETGAALGLGDLDAVDPANTRFVEATRRFLSQPDYARLRSTALDTIDGRGAERVTRKIYALVAAPSRHEKLRRER